MSSQDKTFFTLQSDLNTLIFDLDRHHFLSAISNEYQCSICFNIAKDPVFCSSQCLSLYCRSCLKLHLDSIVGASRLFCPNCRYSGEFEIIFHDAIDSRRLIRNLSVRCVFHEEGCEWTGIFGDDGHQLLSHLKETCGEIYITCTQKCGEKRLIQRKKMATEHLQHECSHRPFVCEFCKASVLFKDKQQHLLQCDALPVSCPHGCSEDFSKVQLSHHLLHTCPNIKHVCPFKCRTRPFTSKALEKHLKDSHAAHSQSMLEENKRMTENFSWFLSSAGMNPMSPINPIDPTTRLKRLYPTLDGPCTLDLSAEFHLLTIDESHPSLKWLNHAVVKKRHLIVTCACFNHDQPYLYLGGYLTSRSSIQSERDSFCDITGELNGLFRINVENMALEHVWSWPTFKNVEPHSIIMIDPQDYIFKGKNDQFPLGAILVFFEGYEHVHLFCFNPHQPLHPRTDNDVVVRKMKLRKVWQCKLGGCERTQSKIFWSSLFGKLIYICNTPDHKTLVFASPLSLFDDNVEEDHRIITGTEFWTFPSHVCKDSHHRWDLDLSFLSDDHRYLYMICKECHQYFKMEINYTKKKVNLVDEIVSFSHSRDELTTVLSARQDSFGMFEFVTRIDDDVICLRVYDSKQVFQWETVLCIKNSVSHVFTSDKNQVLLLSECEDQIVTRMDTGQWIFPRETEEKWNYLQRFRSSIQPEKDVLIDVVKSVVDKMMENTVSSNLKRNSSDKDIKETCRKKKKIEDVDIRTESQCLGSS